MSEIFLADITEPEHYLEVEMTPAGEGVALEFQGVRKRSDAHHFPQEKLWKGLQFLDRDETVVDKGTGHETGVTF